MRIDKEQGQYFAMSRIGGIGEAKRMDAVLHDVWEGHEAPLAGHDLAQFLDGLLFVLETVYGLDGFVVVLAVAPGRVVVADSLPETEMAFCDVVAVVVVQGGGATVEQRLVLLLRSRPQCNAVCSKDLSTLTLIR